MHEIIRKLLIEVFNKKFPCSDIKIINEEKNLKWDIVNLQILSIEKIIIDCIFYENKQIVSVVFLKPDTILEHKIIEYIDPLDTVDFIVQNYNKIKQE